MKVNFVARYPAVRMQPNWELLAEMAASAVIGAYTWWMEHPDNADIEDGKRLVERAQEGVMASI